jgi:hypothetical protein
MREATTTMPTPTTAALMETQAKIIQSMQR